jgi:hypothetical protein
VSPWIDHLGRVSYIRGHISLFAAGSVILLAIDLLSGSGRVWADTAISLWAVLLVVHGILAVIARLLRELLSEDEPASPPIAEATWRLPGGWERPHGPEQPAPPAERPATPPAGQANGAIPRPNAGTERVSWAEATRAAWLARRRKNAEPDVTRQPDVAHDDTPNTTNDNDFTPLKLD